MKNPNSSHYQLYLFSATAQLKDEAKPEGFQFTTVKELPITSVKTRPVPAPVGVLLLSRLNLRLRQGYKGDLDLAEMFVVSNAYVDKAVKYVRVDGHLNMLRAVFSEMYYACSKSTVSFQFP